MTRKKNFPPLKSFLFETDIDECRNSKPCQNGEQCENTHGSYICTCKPGFTGKNSEAAGLSTIDEKYTVDCRSCELSIKFKNNNDDEKDVFRPVMSEGQRKNSESLRGEGHQ